MQLAIDTNQLLKTVMIMAVVLSALLAASMLPPYGWWSASARFLCPRGK